MKIFCDEQYDEKQVAVCKPILEKPEKGQQPKPAYHFVDV